MAISFSERISRWMSPAVTSGRSAMMMSAGQWNCASAQLIASFSDSFLTATSASSCLKGCVQSRVALHPDFSTEAITSSSIARANASRSSWLRMQERRVLGFTGLKGMSA